MQHTGELSSAFNTEASVEYMDDQEVTGKLDFMRASWQRLEVTAQLTTPFEDWTQTQAEYRHSADAGKGWNRDTHSTSWHTQYRHT